MIGYIYKYCNTLNNKVYIGQTTNLVNRKSKHRSCAESIKNKFYNAVRKYKWESFEFSILAEVVTDSVEECSKQLDFLESFYILLYDSLNNGYNSTPGGHAPRGMKRSEEYKEYCRNRTYSKECREKMSKAAKNRMVSEETREKLRQVALKRNFAAYREHNKEKIAEAVRKARSKIVLQLDNEGNIVKEHSSARAAAQYIIDIFSPNLSFAGAENAILRHCKGKTKKNNYCGFVWKYKTDV